MVKKKELESEYIQVVIKIMENGILIKNMAAERWNGQMVAVIGGNSRIIRQKDMEYGRVLMETDTSGNSVMMTNTGMEYTDGLMEMYITENTNRIKEMVKDIRGGQVVALNIGESTRMASNGERESHKRREYSTEWYMKMESSLAGVNILWLMRRNE